MLCLTTCALVTLLAAPPAAPGGHRVFPAVHPLVDTVLARPYTSEVPFGSSGDRVWATSPQGWGFPDGVHLLYVTNLAPFDVSVTAGGVAYKVASARYTPSHVHMIGAPGQENHASASFTYSTDRVDSPLTAPFRPEKRWTCWSSGSREDWYALDLNDPRPLTAIRLAFFDDQPTGGCAPPESAALQTWTGGAWVSTGDALTNPRPGLNTLKLHAPLRASRIRLLFRNRGTDRYTGLYEALPLFAGPPPTRPSVPGISVTGDKWITRNDVLVSSIRVSNTSPKPLSVLVSMDSPLSGSLNEYADQHSVEGHTLYLSACGASGPLRTVRFLDWLNPGQQKTFLFACAVGNSPADARARRDAVLAQSDPLARQSAEYQGWFDANTATFTCSDPAVSKMYLHRWYNVKKNSMNPHLGALSHRAFSEGRWTSDWYANVISYGAGHQIREARWLRDPSYAWGHLQTFTDNARPDGIYPSHVTPAGSAGGQYTDWISSTAWEAWLVHPDREKLASVSDALARNTEAWKSVYGWNNSPLLVVDSHWWTGMEWQPSFFSFAGYHTGRETEVPLRRVDLTAYNYANASNTARVFQELGRPADAARMQALADETRTAALASMWSPGAGWFQSLRASDNAQAPADEIIGLYPFAFRLPPAGKGYEAAWRKALDPRQFWTPWPLASASLACPAYSQTGWPVGPGGSGCMWNGPSWPHANSLVMLAMANALRYYGPSAVTRDAYYKLFHTFTMVQYRDQKLEDPWTGEFYNGDTGQWKTDQRDYNHSTWVDPLITDLVGIVPRSDNRLEVDSLLPAGAWSYYLLDGQSYRGHDISVAYDARGGHLAPGFQGFAVYIDGRCAYRAKSPAHVLLNLSDAKLQSARSTGEDYKQ